MMKIALLNTFDGGGAGKAALRLNKGLNLIGEKSRLFVKHKTIDDEDVTQVISAEVNNKLFDQLALKYFIGNIKDGNTISSLMYPSVGFEYLNIFKNYDAINLHWIPSFVSVEAIMKLDSMQKPLVWTLHDQNPFTGACHYTHGCEKYKSDCSNCPQLVTNPYDITKHILEAKIKYLPKNITIVTPSTWLAECARESTLFKNHRIEVIANSLETDIYKPSNKSNLKQELGLSEKTKIILFGAEDLNENRKGLQYLLDSINYLKQNNKIKKLLSDDELCVLTFGKPSPILDGMDFPYKALGYIDKDEKLAEIYSVADVLVLPSIEDNLPNMMLESLSCGTPVVGFNTGGIKDVIVDGYNGFLCEIGDAVSFADKIASILFSDVSISDNCRQYAQESFALKVQAVKYKALFEDLIINKSSKYFSIGNVPRVLPELSEQLMDWICDISVDIENQINNLEHEKNEIIADRKGLKDERDILVGELESLKQERDTVVSERDHLKQERDTVVAQRESVEQERDAIVAERETLEQERDTVVAERESLRQERDTVVAEREALVAELHSVYGSKSWRLTKSLRYIGRKLR
jgi:glycosyltransferase involved in cell wall biosynthesis